MKNLFNSDFYRKRYPDVAKSRIDEYDEYDHYVNYGVFEGREACLNFKGLTLEQVKNLYYHAISDDPSFPKTLSHQAFPFFLKSDMVAHLPVLEFYASECNHVTELGIRHGHSTIAFLTGLHENGKLVSYDVEETPFTKWLTKLSCKKWEFLKEDTTNTSIVPTDLIFFDTFHCYDQLKAELTLHAEKARKFLVFHDTVSYADVCSEDPTKEGIKRAIDEYMAKNHCKAVYKTNACNGLLILEKT